MIVALLERSLYRGGYLVYGRRGGVIAPAVASKTFSRGCIGYSRRSSACIRCVGSSSRYGQPPAGGGGRGGGSMSMRKAQVPYSNIPVPRYYKLARFLTHLSAAVDMLYLDLIAVRAIRYFIALSIVRKRINITVVQQYCRGEHLTSQQNCSVACTWRVALANYTCTYTRSGERHSPYVIPYIFPFRLHDSQQHRSSPQASLRYP